MRSKAIRPLAGALALAFTACASSQEGTVVQSPQTPPAQVIVQGDQIDPGTQLVAALEQTIGKNTPPGTTFTAQVIQPVVDPEGYPIIPAGSQMMGRVLAVQSASGNQPAAVSLSIDSLLVGGVQHPISGAIVATDVRGSGRTVKGKYVGVGAGGGALVGGILGGWQGAVIGGLAGAATGTAISLGVTGNEAKLPQGTALVVRLDRPLSVAALRGSIGAM